MTLDRHSPELKLNAGPLPDPSLFSLPSTFKEDTVVCIKKSKAHSPDRPSWSTGWYCDSPDTNLKFIFLYRQPVFRIRIRIRIHRIHMSLGLPDPDPFVRGMDSDPDPGPDPDPHQNVMDPEHYRDSKANINKVAGFKRLFLWIS